MKTYKLKGLNIKANDLNEAIQVANRIDINRYARATPLTRKYLVRLQMAKGRK